MTSHLFSSKNKMRRGSRAQAILEFAIALPILMMILVGLLEVGRMILIYSAVTNASRNAVRYASAVGKVDNVANKYAYNDCAGIRTMAVNSAFLVGQSNLTVTIQYDHGPGTGAFDTCDGNLDTGVTVTTGDRVVVQVVAQYRPMVRIVPIPNRTFTSLSYRTIIGVLKLK